MSPEWPKSGVFWHFLDFESLHFSAFVYYDRQQWYLAGTGGYCTQKNNWVQIGTILDLSPNYFCLQIHFLEIASLVFANFAYNDRQVWYLTGVGGLNVWKKYFGLETSLVRVMTSSICVNRPYIRFSPVLVIEMTWYCIIWWL